MRRPRSTRGDGGFATAEFAVALPALVLVLAMILGGLQAVLLHHQALHAASVGARMAARGQAGSAVVAVVSRTGPAGAVSTTRDDGKLVTVSVRPVLPSSVAWALPDLTAEVTAVKESALEDDPEAGAGT